MADNIRKLSDGSWQCDFEDASGKTVTQTFKAGSEEEAERLAEAYRRRMAAEGKPVKRVARGSGPKGKSSLLN